MKIGQEDRIEMYRAFYEEMLRLGYSPEYIGKQLAHIVRATEKDEGE